jgi:tetratricopeptide (TPR) repeat protein
VAGSCTELARSDALTIFDVTLATEPDDYSGLLGRGRCHRLLGAYDEAIADFTHAHQLRPRAARPLFERGAISILIGHYDDSLTDSERAATLDPTYPGSASYFAELREPDERVRGPQPCKSG